MRWLVHRLLCAVGRHEWGVYRLRSRERECVHCPRVDERIVEGDQLTWRRREA